MAYVNIQCKRCFEYISFNVHFQNWRRIRSLTEGNNEICSNAIGGTHAPFVRIGQLEDSAVVRGMRTGAFKYEEDASTTELMWQMIKTMIDNHIRPTDVIE